MAQINCIVPLMMAMKMRPDMTSTALYALITMFQVGDDELIKQVGVIFKITPPLDAKIVDLLLLLTWYKKTSILN